MSKKTPVKGAGVFTSFLKLPTKAIDSYTNLGRNTKLASVLVVILVFVGLWATVFHRNETFNSTESARQEEVVDIQNAPEIKATLSLKEGVVEQRNELGEWSDSIKDTELKNGMGLRTVGAASRAVITLEDDSVVRLDANTEIVFETLTKARVLIEQKSGYVYSRVIPSDGRTFVVQTENAQFHAQGTAFRTIASGDEEAVEVFQSSVKETDGNKTAKEGEKLTAKSEVNPDKDGKIEKLDIEVIKKDLFMIWNREQDQQSDLFKNQLGFLKDFDGPKIEVSEPAAGSTITVPNESPQGSVNIKGRVDKGSTLTVQSKSTGGSSPATVTVSEDGSFDTGAITAPMGSSIFELVATDPVGNKTTLNLSYVFKRPATVQEQGILLKVTQTNDKIKLEWGLIGISTPDGIKIVSGSSENPTKVIETVPTGATTKEISKSGYTVGKTYHFRVCRYLASTDTCDPYSNDISIIIE